MPYNDQIPGFMEITSLKILEHLAGRVPPKGVIVEIGSFVGRSSWTIAKSCEPSVTVYCVDSWEDAYLNPLREHPQMAARQQDQTYNFDLFKENTKDCPNIVILKGRSTKVPWPDDRQIDFLFIDGWHESPDVDNDIATWLPRLKPGGILSGHDFHVFNYPDVCRAVIAVSKRLEMPIKFFKKSTIWMIDPSTPAECPYEMLVSNPTLIQQIEEVLEKNKLRL